MNFWSQFEKGFTCLAPMEGVTDIAFRQVIARAARPDIFFTEFTNVNISDIPDNPDTPEEEETATTVEQPNMLEKYYNDHTIGDYSMSNLMDQQLMRNVEQFVLQNMSRGQISLEEMATAMGMGRVPFFHKIRSRSIRPPSRFTYARRRKCPKSTPTTS